MNTQTDQQLLQDYAGSRSESAFAELVRRHLDLVHSAALRMVCDSHLAQDITQSVFIALANNAGQLTHHPVLSGWLHRTTQNLAANAVRTNVRRQTREQDAVAMNELLAHESDAVWENIAPHLDTALGELSEPDRDALLLRYFERKSAREMAQTLNVSQEAAQKRVNRAVERLREFFSKRNVTVGASGLVVLISTNGVQAAPVGLIVTISSAISHAGFAVQTSAAIAATKTIAMTTLQKTLITAALAVATGVGIYEASRAANLKKEIELLRQQPVFNDPAQKEQRDNDDFAKQLAALREENERLNRNTSELAKLRNKVSQLQSEMDGAAAAAKEYQAELEEALKSIPPVRTFVSTTVANAAWDEAIVTGGWKTPSGKRVIVLTTLERLDDSKQLTINSRVLEYAEEAGEKAGLSRFNTDEGKLPKAHTLTAVEMSGILKASEDSQEIEILGIPRVTTLSGRQSQVSVQEFQSTPSGENYFTGPVIDLIPTISADGESVQMVTTTQLLYPNPNPLNRRR